MPPRPEPITVATSTDEESVARLAQLPEKLGPPPKRVRVAEGEEAETLPLGRGGEAMGESEGGDFYGPGVGTPSLAEVEPRGEAESSNRSSIRLPISDGESLWDRGVTGRYIRDMFTERDVAASREIIDKTTNPYRILQFLGLDMLLISKGLEKCHRETTVEAKKLEEELEGAKRASGQALANARVEVAGELEDLRRRLTEAESSKKQAEDLAQKLNEADLKLREELAQAKAEAERSRSDADHSKSTFEKEMAELTAKLEEAKGKLKDEGTRAIAEYKASDVFRHDTATLAAPSYLMGQRRYKEVMVATHPDFDMSRLDGLLPGLLPEEEEEDEDEDEEASVEGEGTTEGVTSVVEPSREEAEVALQSAEVTDLTQLPTGDQSATDAGA